MKLHPVILCGGSGSRLWRLSRDHHPKQLLPLFGTRSLLQETVLGLEGLSDLGAPVVVSNSEYRFLIAEQMREMRRSGSRGLERWRAANVPRQVVYGAPGAFMKAWIAARAFRSSASW